MKLTPLEKLDKNESYYFKLVEDYGQGVFTNKDVNFWFGLETNRESEPTKKEAGIYETGLLLKNEKTKQGITYYEFWDNEYQRRFQLKYVGEHKVIPCKEGIYTSYEGKSNLLDYRQFGFKSMLNQFSLLYNGQVDSGKKCEKDPKKTKTSNLKL